ncbi:GNAT family N-acetyltransferase [Humisphaera borealis]|uniref:N-acetyltransferase n=1 Tax=Humisphaera borealis TaxID=2807512 RepID=A0A7M2X3H6_9BACT|nr:GNAT family N-acetyltransferase [Humisphaera borealis]QOV92179.1 N-acetyltransferase [Humisphaera borealis]
MPDPHIPVQIRPATLADLPAINDIYNHYVIHSTCTYQEEPETMESRIAWFHRHGVSHSIVVATDDVGTILGWGSLSAFHPRSAYRFTVENSVYLRHDVRGRGLGKAILAELISRARDLGFRSIIALIDAEQAASVALHKRAGFTLAGRLTQVGFKFGQWLDVVYMQLTL